MCFVFRLKILVICIQERQHHQDIQGWGLTWSPFLTWSLHTSITSLICFLDNFPLQCRRVGMYSSLQEIANNIFFNQNFILNQNCNDIYDLNVKLFEFVRALVYLSLGNFMYSSEQRSLRVSTSWHCTISPISKRRIFCSQSLPLCWEKLKVHLLKTACYRWRNAWRVCKMNQEYKFAMLFYWQFCTGR